MATKANETVLTLRALIPDAEPFRFSRYEIPEKIAVGGEQALAVHKHVGGARTIDAMGRDDAPLEWSGLFLGSQALDRARYLDRLRIDGTPVEVTWSVFRYTGVIRSYKADFEAFYNLPYQISIEILADKTVPITKAPDTVDQQIKDDFATTKTLSERINDPALTSQVSQARSALDQVQDFAKATRSAVDAVVKPLAEIQRTVQSLIISTENQVVGITTLGGILPSNTVARNAGRMLSTLSAHTRLADLYDLQGAVGRMSGAVQSAGQSGKTVTQAGGDLMSLAQKIYGDPLAWQGLAGANVVVDPVLVGVNTIQIPAAPTSNGGVLTP